MTTMPMRTEADSLGEIAVPAMRLFGPQTSRALANFPLSGVAIGSMRPLVRSLAQVKKAAALTNIELGELESEIGTAILRACDEAIAGALDGEFVVDVLQGGAGTSTNMNMNEVLANRALQLLGSPLGQYDRINPNDHVNRSQSTNDAYATAVRLAVHALNSELSAALRRLSESFDACADAFRDIPKLGRTQLQDAVPMTAGEELGAFATTLLEDVARADEIAALFLEVNLGGTAIGTRAGASPAYCDAVIPSLAAVTGLPVVRARNLVEATWDMGAFVLYSGMLKRVASKLSKISNDLRLLASGPRCGLGELRLPQRQPGSSLMPGKVNPVIPEAVNQAAFRVFGADTAITFAAEGGQLQLNAFEPLILYSIHESVQLLTAAMDMLRVNCIEGLSVDADRCRHHLEQGTAEATLLVPLLGYAQATELAKSALRENLALSALLRRDHPEILELLRSANTDA